MKRNNRYVTIALAAVMTFFAAGCDKTEMEGKGDGGSASGDAIGISALISDPQAKVDYAPKYDDNGEEVGIKLTWNEDDVIFGFMEDQDKPLVYKVVEITADGKSASFESAADEDGKYGTHEVHTLTLEDEGKNIYFIAHSSTVPDAFWTDPTNFAVDLSVQNGIAINTNNTVETTDDLIEGLNNYAYICATSQIQDNDKKSKKELKLIFQNQFAIMKYDTVDGLEENKTYTFHLKGSGLYNKGTISVSEGSFGFVPDGEGEIIAQITTGDNTTGETEKEVDNLFFVVPAGKVTNLTVYATDGSLYKFTDDKIYPSIAFEAGNVSRSTQKHQFIKRLNPVLPGIFTINSSGGKVQFSRGNLYGVSNTYVTDQTPHPETYNKSTAEHWYFENNQYEYHGVKIEGVYKTYHNSALNKDMILGNIPESAYNYTNEYGYLGYRVTKKYYGTQEEEYPAGDCFPKIANTLAYRPNEFNEWGKDVDDRDKDGKTWKTLTLDEWKYLIYGRSNYYSAEQCLGRTWQIATIKISEDLTQKGILIYPDDNIDKSKGSTISLSLSEWIAYEQSGCVFLPAGGSITNNLGPDNIIKYVRVWAAPNDDTNVNYIEVDMNSITITYVVTAASGTLAKYSMSVRLVTSATPANSIGDLPYTTW